jgi:DNA-binding NarL/FixJ family response regulator
MKPESRSIRGQSNTTRDGDERKRTAPRVRVLLFACEGDDAQLMMIYSERMEITYLPSYDMVEVREEIERCKPKLILCGADTFLDALPAGSSDVSTRPDRKGTRANETVNSQVSRREMKILSMLAKGGTNDDIAKALRLSSRTVKRNLSSLFERLQVTNRTELASRVAELSILEEDN